MLTPETITTALQPWLSAPPRAVTLDDGTTENTISSGAFAANLVQIAILDTSNPRPPRLIAALVTECDPDEAQTRIIRASASVEELLQLRYELEEALLFSAKKASKQNQAEAAS